MAINSELHKEITQPLIPEMELPVRVRVIWWDAWDEQGLFEKDFAGGVIPALRCDIGFLLRYDQVVVVLSTGIIDNSFSGKQMVAHPIVIPVKFLEAIIRQVDSPIPVAQDHELHATHAGQPEPSENEAQA